MSTTPGRPSRPSRPVRPTRTPTSRPRRVAGSSRGASYVDEASADEATAADEASTEETAGVDLAKRNLAASPPTEPVEPVEPTEPAEPLGRRRLVVLTIAVVLLLVLGAAEVLYLRGVIGDDEQEQQPVSAARPVQLPDLEVRRVVDQAATAADLILSASAKDYDAQVEKATATMTEPFAEKYRTTKADVKDQFVAQQTEVVIDVSAQGVVTASDDEVVALIFLTQTTQKASTEGVTPVQYRVTVTMVDTADGWLVSDLQAL